jgi:hypothetical protein
MEGRDLFQMGLEGKERAVGHAVWRRFDGLIFGVLKGDAIIFIGLVLAKMRALWVVVSFAEIPEPDGGIHRPCGQNVIFHLQCTD